jgi:hypothetical protein
MVNNLTEGTQMKKMLVITAVFTALVLPALAQTLPYYIAGDFNGWSANGNVMTETSPGSGIWQVNLTGVSAGRHEFKVTEGDWSWSFPGPNSWLYAPGSGNIMITYDVNTYADGWSATSQRIGLNADPGTWTAVGDWQGWNNADPTTAMAALGGGIYEYSISTPGSYNWKACVTGSWDSISWDNRSVGTANWAFTVNSGEQANLYVDAFKGVARVDIVPEPSTLAVLGLSSLVMLVAARKRN